MTTSITAKLFEKKMFRGNRSTSRSSLVMNQESRTITNPVGSLDVEVVEAVNLAAADFSGKSDPYVVLELDGQSYRTNTEYHTLSPKWTNQSTKFFVADISSILYVTIYDEDRFGEPEFLGRVGVPVATLRNGARVLRTFYLRDKNLKRYSKGTVDLVLAKKWEPWKVALQSISPHKRPESEFEVFKTPIFVRNVQRVRGILADCMAATKYIQSCFEWSNRAFVLFVLVTYNFELYMVPIAIIVFMFVYPAIRKELRLEYEKSVAHDGTHDAATSGNFDDTISGNFDEDSSGNVDVGDDVAVMEDEPDLENDDSEDVKSVVGRLRALQSVTIFVQNSVGFVASTVESVWTLLEFRVPFLSWIFIGFLVLASIVLYLIPLRWIVMIWGVNKFSKKLRNPNHVTSSELLNFLSRVPDRPTLEKCFFDIDQKPKTSRNVSSQQTVTTASTPTTTMTTIQQKFVSRKTSFLQTRFGKKFSKPDVQQS